MPGMTTSGLPTNLEHNFTRVPGVDHPRSTFERTNASKTSFEAGYLIPIYTDEVLPGDTHQVSAQLFGRLLSPVDVPTMDNLYLDWIAFFAPNRILWTNFVRQQGEQPSPGDTIDFLTPLVNPPAGGWTTHSLGDYFECQVGVEFDVVAYLFRMYNLTYQQWFKDQNLIGTPAILNDDGPDSAGAYPLRRRSKRLDYFTGCLPFAQKGTAPIINVAGNLSVITPTNPIYATQYEDLVGGNAADLTRRGFTGGGSGDDEWLGSGGAGAAAPVSSVAGTTDARIIIQLPGDMYADGSTATGITVNAFRLLVTTQQVIELDARGGTRYTEITRSHFGVISSDARLQRVEFLGAGTLPIIVHPIAQTSESATTPQGTLAGFATVNGGVQFSHSFEEHGHIMVIAEVRADLTYQQGTRRMMFRRTRYDYYLPSFANIGEQAVLTREIFTMGTADDLDVFGYQEVWAEYRYKPSAITGLFRSNPTAGFTSIDVYHLSQDFASQPFLNQTFIEDTPPIERIVADQDQPYFILDSLWRNRTTRVMPVFSVPGLTRI